MDSAAVEIRDVHKRFGKVEALRGVSFTIGRGELFGLLGRNGAGKSTLINVLAGLARADRGSAAILGHDVVTDWRAARRSLGVVPQELIFDPFFSVREVLRFQAGYYGLGRTSRSWIEELIEALDLGPKADANMRTLSGGLKRRVLIAQALVHRPPVVVLDEPTAGVDVDMRRSFWALLERLKAEGRTIVLTTHYLEEAQLLAERIGILDKGSLVALDTKQRLLERGSKKTLVVTAGGRLPSFSDAAGPFAGRVRVLDERRAEIELEAGGLDAALAAVRGLGIELVDLEVKAPDLESVFLDITRRAASEAPR